MTINQIDEQEPFITADGSTIRSILDLSNAPVEKQSLAEAILPPGGATERHWHKTSEEFYFILQGTGTVEIDGSKQEIRVGDAVLIPNGQWHQIIADSHTELRFLCCCAPPYSHEDTFFD
ncbi:MAG: hypothetical protein CMO61_11255 [Verrucomicrobiales bacterium]|jgi:mannose-6-phosphate isomerase-like protein (cupin superfamily)|nr:hypothetical protein [Verrucomicrobiales bacterium]|tara:strand:- start:19104 stop:19463 length:360 start_codon:yes stop_codon:yes gene_type:complete